VVPRSLTHLRHFVFRTCRRLSRTVVLFLPLVDRRADAVSIDPPPFLDHYAELVTSVLQPILDHHTQLATSISPPFLDRHSELDTSVFTPIIDRHAELVASILPPFLDRHADAKATYKEGQDGVCQQTGGAAAAKRRDPTAPRVLEPPLDSMRHEHANATTINPRELRLRAVRATL